MTLCDLQNLNHSVKTTGVDQMAVLTDANIGLTIPGKWSFVADFVKSCRFHMKS